MKSSIILLAALKVKLMVRRPLNTLVEQGLVPSPKTSPFLHDQRQRLERAKMSDSLRAKIAHRPARSELVSKHILEDVPMGVAPSLCDVQRQASQFIIRAGCSQGLVAIKVKVAL